MTALEIIASIGTYFFTIAQAMFMVSLSIIAAAVWGLIIVGSGKLFRNWRRYSRHPLAKRIRAFLRQRNERRSAKAAG